MTDKEIKEIPCKDCISFAICNSIVKKYELIYKTQFIVNKLENRCQLFLDWTYPNPSTDSIILEKFIKCYKIRFNVTPDYYLLKHLGRNF